MQTPREVTPLAGAVTRVTALALTLALAACPPPPPRGSTPAAQVDEQGQAQPVTAIGVVTGIANVSLARQAAQRRATVSVARLLVPEAVRFVYRRVGQHATLETVVEQSKVTLTDAKLEPLANGGWIARVTATRGPRAAATMAALETNRASATVTHKEPSLALTTAESRALRAVIARAVAKTKSGVFAEGTLTLVSLDQRIGAGAVTVSLAAHVHATSQRPLADDARRTVLEAVVNEHLAFGEHQAALAAAERSADPALIKKVKDATPTPRPR